MVEQDALPAETRRAIAQIGSADLVIGLYQCQGVPALEASRPAWEAQFASLPRVSRTVVAYPASAASDNGPEVPPPDGAGLVLLPHPLLAPPEPPSDIACTGEAQHALFALAQALNASACVVLGAGEDTIPAESVGRLAGPLLEHGLDLVMGCRARPRLGGLLNKALVYPLVRALYGRRIRCLIGSDFVLSSRLVERRLMFERVPGTARTSGTLGSLASEAIAGGFQVGQSHLRHRRVAAAEGGELSSVLAQVTGPLFLAMERHAPFWQKIHASVPVPTFGEAEAVADEAEAVNVADMVRSCQLGCRNLQEVWGTVLPPATLLELKKLGTATPEAFGMPDEVWARIVFDFALGHRLRVINRDHLLRSLTPLYLGWVASFLREVQHAALPEVERRVERLCFAYEAQKPYLLSRWRWPDRFNP